MKLPVRILILCALIVLLPSCRKKKLKIAPLSGGFGIASTWVGIDSGPGAALYYQGSNSDPVLIWPFLGGDPTFTNDMAFFVADKPDSKGRLANQAYMAAQAPGPALDISENILKLWAETNHLDFQKMRGRYEPLELAVVTNGMEVNFLGDATAPDATLILNWQQISNIIQEVKRTGKKQIIKDPSVVFLKKDYGPEKHYDGSDLIQPIQ